MIVPFPVLLRPGAEDFVKEASESSAAERMSHTDATSGDVGKCMELTEERTDAGHVEAVQGPFAVEGRVAAAAPEQTNGHLQQPVEAPASLVTDADILLGLVGRPLPWWRFLGW